ncbi:MAG: hypothetical protein JO168_02345 [Solirubrobacterales bacterium]|nr:hypothetical protein [Solirubrobacterales bacterium]MBV9717530.1 hypothetical protein [Solirubrobacterales bacterium]
MREHVVQVRLTSLELSALDTLAAERHQTRSGVLRSALRPVPQAAPPLTRTWALERLQVAAGAGSVNAMAALARELRLGGVASSPRTGPVTSDEVRAALRAVK